MVRIVQVAVLTASLFTLAACGGGSSAASASSSGGSSGSSAQAVTGISTPQSVSVVTAKNAQ